MIENILEKIKSGELSRENDESGAGGFWDYAYEVTGLDGVLEEDEQDITFICDSNKKEKVILPNNEVATFNFGKFIEIVK